VAVAAAAVIAAVAVVGAEAAVMAAVEAAVMAAAQLSAGMALHTRRHHTPSRRRPATSALGMALAMALGIVRTSIPRAESRACSTLILQARTIGCLDSGRKYCSNGTRAAS
jgi:hypothetical protein